MSFVFAIHHVFGRDFFTRYGRDLNELFGGASQNPFHVDANSNKIRLLTDQGLADALAMLSAKGENPFSSAGIGDAAHDSFHPGLTKFQQIVGNEILNQAL